MNSVLMNQMAQLFIMMGMGYGLYKLKYMDAELCRKLTALILDVTMPLLILSSVMNPEGEKNYSAVGSVIFYSFVMYAFLMILSVVLVALIRLPEKQRGLYAFMHTFSNVGFMGFPIINALYGSDAMLYTAIINIFFNLFAYTLGIVLVNYEGRSNGGIRELFRMIDMKVLLSPGTVLSVVAIAVYFVPITFPEIVVGVCKSIGGLTSPMAMLLIGATLAKMPIKTIFNDWHVYLFAVMKQLVVPAAVWPLMKWAISDELVCAVFFILFLMPVANTSVLFATKYNKNEELAAKTVFVTTVLSAVTIPLCLTLFN